MKNDKETKQEGNSKEYLLARLEKRTDTLVRDAQNLKKDLDRYKIRDDVESTSDIN